MSAELDLIWKALADPTRRQILDCLRNGPVTTGALCAQFEMSRFGVAKHIQVLTECGLLIEERRGRERWNHLNAVPLAQATQRWLTSFQSQWSSRLIGLGAYLQENPQMPSNSRLSLNIRQQIDFAVSPARVFSGLTSEINQWWGASFRQTGLGSQLVLEPEIGSAMVEFGSDGHAVVWARVEEIKPNQRLYLAGRFAVEGAVAGRIHFDLEDLGASGCRLTLAHQAIGDIPEELTAKFNAGWRELIGVQLRQYLMGE